MARYKVTLLSPEGKVIKEIIEARNEDELISLLSNRDVILLDYKKDILSEIKNIFFLDFLSSKKISKQELADFCFYVGRSLEMGISILDILEDIKKTSKNKHFQRAVEEIKNLISSGSSLYEAMKSTNMFPGELLGLVKLGEETDALPKIFLNYAEYLDWEIKLQKEVKQALAYPAFVTFVMLITIAIMFGYIVPQVLPAITALGLREYPLPTKVLLWSENFARMFWKKILFLILMSILTTIFLIKRHKKLKFIIDKTKLKLPILGEIFEKSALSTDLRAIAEVYRSGGTILNAIEIIINHIEKNTYLREVFIQVRENLLSGDMLSEAMKKTKFFPEPIIRMVKLGEDTGALDKTLLRLAEIYEDDMRRKIETMTLIIEPALQLILGVILGIIALGILLPVYNVISGIKHG